MGARRESSRALELYQEMTICPNPGIVPIGRGEAAALALAIVNVEKKKAIAYKYIQ